LTAGAANVGLDVLESPAVGKARTDGEANVAVRPDSVAASADANHGKTFVFKELFYFALCVAHGADP
jgi:hypothetical protein